MNKKIRILIPLALLFIMLAVAGTDAAKKESKQQARGQASMDILANWPDASKRAANEVMNKYGQPDGVTNNWLVWQNKGPWREIMVYREEIQHNFPKEHKDVLEQTIAFKVPADRFSDLAEFDGSLIAERTKGILSARCDSEAMNFLALNLANDIVNDRASVDEARQRFAQIAQDFLAGKKHPYTQGFQFQVARAEQTRDPDESLIG
ncbi:MAG: hypothetical protein HY954_11060 [Deltaproteobacteria bacterium]|nr:hypothetical protein [Deltaproteobacteria bacterium]